MNTGKTIGNINFKYIVVINLHDERPWDLTSLRTALLANFS